MYSWLLAALLGFPLLAFAQTAEDEARLARITALPPALQEHFVTRVMRGKATRYERLERMVNFVFDSRGLGMSYQEGATYTVAESYVTRKANCLGFTLLFLALAREAGLEAQPQEIEETLSWQRERGIFFRNSHVNAQVRIGPRHFVLDVARNAVITRGHPKPLTPRRLLARYHNNVAMESLGRGEMDAARTHMAAALELDPAQASHWSNAGVLALRGGDAAAAREAYAHALELDPENTNALFNLVSMARRDGDAGREAEYRERLQRVQQQDPFHHFLQAIDHERAGDYDRAVTHYRRAIKLHRTDHRFHAALAGALQRAGNVGEAREAWRRAIALSDGPARAAYELRLKELGAR